MCFQDLIVNKLELFFYEFGRYGDWDSIEGLKVLIYRGFMSFEFIYFEQN